MITTNLDPVDCISNVEVKINTNISHLSDNPYTFDGGLTWESSLYKIYNQDTNISAGMIGVKDANLKVSYNSIDYDIRITKTCETDQDGSANPIMINGQSDNSKPLGCSIGGSYSDNGLLVCGTQRTWKCSGVNGGASSTTCQFANTPCNTSNPINGQCDNSKPLGCSTGGSYNDNGLLACGTQRTWKCSGVNGGTSSTTCQFNNSPCSISSPINGQCDNSKPLGCSTGGSYDDNGLLACGTQRTWKCSGANGGASSTTCQFNNNPCSISSPINGQCDNSKPLSCLRGSYFNDNGFTTCNTVRLWNCSGSNGGANSTTCQYVNSKCLGSDTKYDVDVVSTNATSTDLFSFNIKEPTLISNGSGIVSENIINVQVKNTGNTKCTLSPPSGTFGFPVESFKIRTLPTLMPGETKSMDILLYVKIFSQTDNKIYNLENNVIGAISFSCSEDSPSRTVLIISFSNKSIIKLNFNVDVVSTNATSKDLFSFNIKEPTLISNGSGIVSENIINVQVKNTGNTKCTLSPPSGTFGFPVESFKVRTSPTLLPGETKSMDILLYVKPLSRIIGNFENNVIGSMSFSCTEDSSHGTILIVAFANSYVRP